MGRLAANGLDTAALFSGQGAFWEFAHQGYRNVANVPICAVIVAYQGIVMERDTP